MGYGQQATVTVVPSAWVSPRMGTPVRVPEKSLTRGPISKGVGRLEENHKGQHGSPGLVAADVQRPPLA